VRKMIFALLLISFCGPSLASVSKHQARQIFNDLVKANGIRATLSFNNSSDVNAYGGNHKVVLLEGLLQMADRDIIITVIAHELGHVIGYRSELRTDLVSGRIANAAGMNVCPGAYKFLVNGPGRKGGNLHPKGIIRYNAMCKQKGPP